MSTFGERLREERKRLAMNQTEFALVGGVKKETQSNYETGTRRPDSAYLEAIAGIGVDVAFLLTGMRASGGTTSTSAAEASLQAEGIEARYLTREEAALLDNYNAADEKGRAAARSVLDALAEPKKRANG